MNQTHEERTKTKILLIYENEGVSQVVRALSTTHRTFSELTPLSAGRYHLSVSSKTLWLGLRTKTTFKV